MRAKDLNLCVLSPNCTPTPTCHPDRSGPAFSCARFCAQGHEVEGSRLALSSVATRWDVLQSTRFLFSISGY
jgi:hypothetical protein